MRRRTANSELGQRLQARLRGRRKPKKREWPEVVAERRKRKASLDMVKRENAKEMRLSEMARRARGGW